MKGQPTGFSIDVQRMLRIITSERVEDHEKEIEAWAKSVDITDLETACLMLVPAFVECLERSKLALPHPMAMKKMVRFWWLKNAWLSREAGRIVETLTSEGIEVYGLKGWVVQGHYPLPYLRTMSDADILVKPESLLDTVDVMVRLGFNHSKKRLKALRKRRRVICAFTHGMTFHHEALDLQIDLHWTLGNSLPWKREKELRNSARTGAFSALIPDTMHMVYMSIVNGVSAEAHNPVWVLDVWFLTRAWGKEEWATLGGMFEADLRVPSLMLAQKILEPVGMMIPVDCSTLDKQSPYNEVDEILNKTSHLSFRKRWKVKTIESWRIVRTLSPDGGVLQIAWGLMLRIIWLLDPVIQRDWLRVSDFSMQPKSNGETE